MAGVNTVLGPISADELGTTLIHEHIVFGYPGWYAHATTAPFEREPAMRQILSVLADVKECGVKTIVDATMNDTGRDAGLLREVSEKSGMNIVAATGLYTEKDGAAQYFKFRKNYFDAETEIADLFTTEIVEGIQGTGIKAGVIKVGSSQGVITDYEQMVFRAAVRAHKETGVPIITHTESGTMGPEQCELLLSEGADPARVMIGHMSDNLDIRYHLETLKHGVSLGFDRMGAQGLLGLPHDNERVPVILGLVGTGYADKIMLAHDSEAYWLGRPLNLWELIPGFDGYPTHVFKNIVPRLKNGGVTDEQIETIFVGNPRRLFGGE